MVNEMTVDFHMIFFLLYETLLGFYKEVEMGMEGYEYGKQTVKMRYYCMVYDITLDFQINLMICYRRFWGCLGMHRMLIVLYRKKFD